jgi:hypothetical protein
MLIVDVDNLFIPEAKNLPSDLMNDFFDYFAWISKGLKSPDLSIGEFRLNSVVWYEELDTSILSFPGGLSKFMALISSSYD